MGSLKLWIFVLFFKTVCEHKCSQLHDKLINLAFSSLYLDMDRPRSKTLTLDRKFINMSTLFIFVPYFFLVSSVKNIFDSKIEYTLSFIGPVFIVIYSCVVSGILEAIKPGGQAYLNRDNGCAAAIVLFSLPVVVFSAWMNFKLFTKIRTSLVKPAQILLIALTTHLAFAEIYWSAYVIGASQNQNIAFTVYGFLQPNNGTFTGPLHIEAYIAFLYFSVATGTTTGFGDISVAHWTTDILSSIHMAITTIYTVGLFSISVSQFQVYEKSKQDPNKNLSALQTCTKRLRSLPCVEQLRKFVIKWIFVLSFVLQMVSCF